VNIVVSERVIHLLESYTTDKICRMPSTYSHASRWFDIFVGSHHWEDMIYKVFVRISSVLHFALTYIHQRVRAEERDYAFVDQTPVPTLLIYLQRQREPILPFFTLRPDDIAQAPPHITVLEAKHRPRRNWRHYITTTHLSRTFTSFWVGTIGFHLPFWSTL